ncbi:hypothetical protein J6590_097564 [Homalodisca vitripennis]|nr:hypothetical protein J6590_097564 [Homalodisca vitripennis]
MSAIIIMLTSCVGTVNTGRVCDFHLDLGVDHFKGLCGTGAVIVGVRPCRELAVSMGPYPRAFQALVATVMECAPENLCLDLQSDHGTWSPEEASSHVGILRGGGFTFFSSARKYPRLVSVFNTLERVYQELQHKTSDIKRAVKFLGIYAVALMSVSSFDRMLPMNHSETSLEQAFSFTIFFVTIVLLYCSQAALLVHFTHVAQSIAKSFEVVNAKIEIKITSPASVDGTHTRCTMQSKIKRLRTLMNTYWMLCDAVQQANVFYCDQLMAVTFSSFLHITVTS